MFYICETMKKRKRKEKVCTFTSFVSVRLTEKQLTKLDSLIESGKYGDSQSQVIRTLIEQA